MACAAAHTVHLHGLDLISPSLTTHSLTSPRAATWSQLVFIGANTEKHTHVREEVFTWIFSMYEAGM